ncbi:hypothetical protein [Glycomyces sp. MUSA5-2]|uniref:hypothetical protein n=1 Tax=Glycomyces sp. MUSA5-2 TaxID=2053002 RepID=UPI00300BC9B6
METPAQHGPDTHVSCVGCDGTGSILIRCSCTRTTGEHLIEDAGTSSPVATALAFPDCRVCNGSGTHTLTCNACSGAGAIRPQVVYTAVNLDTGAIASETLIPGALTPVPHETSPGRIQHWELPASAVVDRLVAAVGGELDRRHATADLYRKNLPLPNTWAPEVPHARRLEFEAIALARAQTLTRHRHFFTTQAAASRTAAPDRLSTLARVADLVHVDLRCCRFPASGATGQDRPAWTVVFAVPTDDLPFPDPGPVLHATLDAALTAADPVVLLRRAFDEVDPSRPAPAAFIDPAHLQPVPGDTRSDTEVIAAQLATLAGEDTGALAIRRAGTWHYTRLDTADAVERFTETATGQIRRTIVPTWTPADAPPPPAWRGRPIPERVCLQCETGTTWVPCECIDTLTGHADPLCDACGGTGSRPSATCTMCGRTGRLRYGYTVTVTDLDSFARHWNFDFDTRNDHEPQLWSLDPELRRYQLPESDRLTARLFDAGIDYADLRTLTNLAPTPDLVDGGTLAPPGTPLLDVVHQHTRERAAGHAGGRIVLVWQQPAAATVSQAVRLAWGLGFDLVIGAEDRNTPAAAGTAHSGMRWGAAFLRPGQAADRTLTAAFGKRHLADALQAAIDGLPHQLNIARDGKPGPTEVVPAPQQPDPPHVGGTERLEAVLSRLATTHTGTEVAALAVRLAPASVSVGWLVASAEASVQSDVPILEAPSLAELLERLG